MLSSTVTIAEQVDEFPLLSVTVRTTVFAPTFKQENELCDKLLEAIPQASLEPLSICEAVIEAFPDASS